jgi:hypothetical protein
VDAAEGEEGQGQVKQELHWVGPDRNVYTVTSQPDRVWALPGDQSRAYVLPFAPIHGFNAWSLDVGHDWAMRGPKRCLRYSPGGGDHKGAWLLCEWEEKTEKSK